MNHSFAKLLLSLLAPAALLGLVSAVADADAQIDFSGQTGCGPPRLLSKWPNITVGAGNPVKLVCPLDTQNSCLIDSVEWYFGHHPQDRTLLRDAAVKFDPLLVVFTSASADKTGWYTCIVGNGEGKAEKSAYLEVRMESHRGSQDSRPRGAQDNRPRGHQERPRGSYQQQGPSERAPQPLIRPPTETVTPRVATNNDWRREYGSVAVEEEQDSNNNQEEIVDTRFPVYSRFRGHRGFNQHYQAVPQQQQQQPQAVRQQQQQVEAVHVQDHVRQHEEGSGAQGQLESIHQHLRYLYDRMDEFQSQMERMEERLKRLELI